MKTEKTELLLGAGNNRSKKIWINDEKTFNNLVNLDIDVNTNPDIIWDLNTLPLPFFNDRFDEIHAYDVLEHLGRQGDWAKFFKEFGEYHRILKPDGLFFINAPNYTSEWAWGDPGHTRVFSPGLISFLSQDYYKDVGVTTRTDYRFIWKKDFKILHCQVTSNDMLQVILQANKKDNNAS